MIRQGDLVIPFRAASAARRGLWLRSLGWFVALAALGAALFHRTIVDMANTWLHDVTYGHGFLILPISAGLMVLHRRTLAYIPPNPEPRALPIVLLCGFGWLLGAAAEVLLIQELALVAMLIALFILVFGREIARRMMFPLGFLFFMVPMGDSLVAPLQDLTARFAVALLRLMEIPVFLDGIIIEIPNGTFLVAEACAGLRFLIANLVISALFAWLAFVKPWKRAAFLIVGFVLPIFANGLRAFGIILIAHWTDNRFAAGVDHVVYGWGFFAVVMIALLLIGVRFADRPLADAFDATPPPRPAYQTRAAIGPALALITGGIMAAAPAYAWTVMAPPDNLRPPVLAAPAPAGWTVTAAAGPEWRPRFDGADARLMQRYRSEGGAVDLFVAYYTHQRQGAEVVYHANHFEDGVRFHRVESGRLDLPAGNLPTAGYDRLEGPGGPRLVVWWYWVGGRFTSDPYIAKLYQSIATLTGLEPDAAMLAVSTDLDNRPEAAARIARFVQVLKPDGWLEAVD
jgi:exosortase A